MYVVTNFQIETASLFSTTTRCEVANIAIGYTAFIGLCIEATSVSAGSSLKTSRTTLTGME